MKQRRNKQSIKKSEANSELNEVNKKGKGGILDWDDEESRISSQAAGYRQSSMRARTEMKRAESR